MTIEGKVNYYVSRIEIETISVSIYLLSEVLMGTMFVCKDKSLGTGKYGTPVSKWGCNEKM